MSQGQTKTKIKTAQIKSNRTIASPKLCAAFLWLHCSRSWRVKGKIADRGKARVEVNFLILDLDDLGDNQRK